MNKQASSLDALRVTSETDQPETLAQCLVAILALNGSTRAYSELCCALGTAVMVSLRRTARVEDRWNTFGRHAFVEDAAREEGLELRPLHPPQAAPTPPAPSEFDLHWRDSYMPLVHASVERGEPVLAWMGWPAPHRTQWGVITAIDNDGVARGLTPGCGNVPVRLVGPPVQAYCASAVEPVSTATPGRLDGLLRRFGRVLRNEIPRDYGVITGVPALESLRDETSPSVARMVLKRMSADRSEAIVTLRCLAKDADRQTQERLVKFVEIIQQQIDIAARFTRDSAGDPLGRLVRLESRIASFLT